MNDRSPTPEDPESQHKWAQPQLAHPIQCFPSKMRAVTDDLERECQSAVGVAPSQVLATASAACQAHAVVELPVGSGIRVPLTVGMLTIGSSGTRLSSVQRFVLAPWTEKTIQEAKSYDERLNNHHAEVSVWKIQLKHRKKLLTEALKANDATKEAEATCRLKDWELCKPVTPIKRTLTSSDFSPASLHSLAKNNPGFSIVSPEGTEIFQGKGLAFLTVLNKAFDNLPISEDRISRASTVIAKPRIGFNVTIQTKEFLKVSRERGEQARGNGFYARLLICACHPRATPAETLETRPPMVGLTHFNAACAELIDTP